MNWVMFPMYVTGSSLAEIVKIENTRGTLGHPLDTAISCCLRRIRGGGGGGINYGRKDVCQKITVPLSVGLK